MNSKLFLLLTLLGLICSVTQAATQAISVNYVKVLGSDEEISSFGINSEGSVFPGWTNTLNGSINNVLLDDGRATAINVSSIRPAENGNFVVRMTTISKDNSSLTSTEDFIIPFVIVPEPVPIPEPEDEGMSSAVILFGGIAGIFVVIAVIAGLILRGRESIDLDEDEEDWMDEMPDRDVSPVEDLPVGMSLDELKSRGKELPDIDEEQKRERLGGDLINEVSEMENDDEVLEEIVEEADESSDDGIRILLATIATSAAKIDKAITPILGMFDGHHVRVTVLVKTSKNKATQIRDKIGWRVRNEDGVPYKFVIHPNQDEIDRATGPMWTGPIYPDARSAAIAVEALSELTGMEIPLGELLENARVIEESVREMFDKQTSNVLPQPKVGDDPSFG